VRVTAERILPDGDGFVACVPPVYLPRKSALLVRLPEEYWVGAQRIADLQACSARLELQRAELAQYARGLDKELREVRRRHSYLIASLNQVTNEGNQLVLPVTDLRLEIRALLFAQGFHPRHHHPWWHWPRWIGCSHCLPAGLGFERDLNIVHAEMVLCRGLIKLFHERLRAALRPVLRGAHPNLLAAPEAAPVELAAGVPVPEEV
jgi:hypothetical protein